MKKPAKVAPIRKSMPPRTAPKKAFVERLVAPTCESSKAHRAFPVAIRAEKNIAVSAARSEVNPAATREDTAAKRVKPNAS